MSSIVRRIAPLIDTDSVYTPLLSEHPVTAIARQRPCLASNLLATLSAHRLQSDLHHDDTLLAIERERGYTSRYIASEQTEIERIRSSTSITLARIEADRSERQSMIHGLSGAMVAAIQGDPHRNHYAGEVREGGWGGKRYSMQIHKW